MNTKRKSLYLPVAEQGAAILIVTILILLVATIGTLMVGRVGVVEQKAVGSDTRNKEVYSAAVGGLEFGVNWIQSNGTNGSNFMNLVWTDTDGDNIVEAGDTASPAAMGNTVLNTGTYAHNITYRLMTNLDHIERESGDEDGDGDSEEIKNILPVVIRVESTASQTADTQVSKTASVDIMVGGEEFLSGIGSPNIGEFEGPPLIVEGCVTGSITGTPAINFDIDGNNAALTNTAMASTMMYGVDADGDGNPDYTSPDVDGCLPEANMDGHLSFCEIDVYPDGCPNNGDISFGDAVADPNIDEFRMGLPNPTSLWDTIFGADTTMADLLQMEANDPLNVIIVDTPGGNSTLHYEVQRATFTGWNGNTWHVDLGSATDPVILFFAEEVDCPAINGSTVIYGLVYYEKEVCSNNGWGGGKIYGSVAKAGNLTDMNANAVIIATSNDFGNAGAGSGTGTGTGEYFPVGISTRMTVIPGTWKDY